MEIKKKTIYNRRDENETIEIISKKITTKNLPL